MIQIQNAQVNRRWNYTAGRRSKAWLTTIGKNRVTRLLFHRTLKRSEGKSGRLLKLQIINVFPTPLPHHKCVQMVRNFMQYINNFGIKLCTSNPKDQMLATWKPHICESIFSSNYHDKKKCFYCERLAMASKNQRLSRACIVHLVIKKNNWSYVKTMSCSGSHLGITINIKNTKFVKDLPMIDAQFRFNQCNSFREEYISVFSHYGPVLILWPVVAAILDFRSA